MKFEFGLLRKKKNSQSIINLITVLIYNNTKVNYSKSSILHSLAAGRRCSCFCLYVCDSYLSVFVWVNLFFFFIIFFLELNILLKKFLVENIITWNVLCFFLYFSKLFLNYLLKLCAKDTSRRRIFFSILIGFDFLQALFVDFLLNFFLQLFF